MDAASERDYMKKLLLNQTDKMNRDLTDLSTQGSLNEVFSRFVEINGDKSYQVVEEEINEYDDDDDVQCACLGKCTVKKWMLKPAKNK